MGDLSAIVPGVRDDGGSLLRAEIRCLKPLPLVRRYNE
jgi:hypothetical protein